MTDQAFGSYRRAPALSRAALDALAFWALAGALVALLALPMFLVDVVPMIDFPAHLARVALLSHLPLDPLLARAWAVDMRPLPNLAIDIFVPLLAPVMGAQLALKLFMTLGLALWVAGAALIYRGLWREFSPQPLFAVFFAANPTYYYGFANFHFGAGLALTACGLWLCERRRGPVLIAAMSASALVLLFCHLMAVAILALLLGGFELGRLVALRARPREVAKALAQGVVIFLPAALIWAFVFEHGRETGVEFKWLANLMAFFLYSSFAGAVSYNAAPALAMLGAFALAWRAGRLEISARAAPAVALAAAAMLLCPAVAMSGAVINQRLPAVVAVLLLAACRLNPTAMQRRNLVAATLLGALVAGDLATIRWSAGAETIDEIRAAAQAHIEPGARVATALAQPGDNQLANAVALTALDRQAFVPSFFATKGQSTIVVKDAYRDIAAQDALEGAYPTLAEVAPMLGPQRRDLTPQESRALRPYRDLACTFDYLYLIGARPPGLALPAALQPLAQSAQFALYRIAPPPERHCPAR